MRHCGLVGTWGALGALGQVHFEGLHEIMRSFRRGQSRTGPIDTRKRKWQVWIKGLGGLCETQRLWDISPWGLIHSQGLHEMICCHIGEFGQCHYP